MIRIHRKFDNLFKEKTRYYVITGERGSAKSFTTALYLTYKLLQPNQTIYFTRYTLESAKDSIVPEFYEKVELINATNELKINRLDIENKKNNSVIKFRGVKASSGSQTAKLKGLTNANIWVIDEAEEFTDEALFDKLNKSIRMKNEKNIIILILNPTYKKHWIYKKFFKDVEVPEDFNGIKNNVCYINMKWRDNLDNLDIDTINENEKLEKENPKKYKKDLTSGWLDPEDGLCFPKFETFTMEQIKEIRTNDFVSYIDTADKGADYFAMPICEIINNKLYLIDVIYTQQPLTVTKPITIEKINKYKIANVVIETNKEGTLFVSDIRDGCPDSIIRGIHNSTKKETRILLQAEWLLENLYIRSDIEKESEYYKFITDVLDYEINPKEKQHDDAPDSLSGLSKFVRIYL